MFWIAPFILFGYFSRMSTIVDMLCTIICYSLWQCKTPIYFCLNWTFVWCSDICYVWQKYIKSRNSLITLHSNKFLTLYSTSIETMFFIRWSVKTICHWLSFVQIRHNKQLFKVLRFWMTFYILFHWFQKASNVFFSVCVKSPIQKKSIWYICFVANLKWHWF